MSGRQPRDPWGTITRWTIVRRVTDGSDVAWRELIERYREPIAGGVRRQLLRLAPSMRPPDADEIVDDFFGWAFERGVIRRADTSQGRFRCFMQGVIKNYVFQALRARGTPAAELTETMDESYGDKAGVQEEREWAESTLSRVIESMAREHPRDTELLLDAYGLGPRPIADRAELARRVDLTPNALDQVLFRARQRMRAFIECEIRDTVTGALGFSEEYETVVERLLEAHPQMRLGAL